MNKRLILLIAIFSFWLFIYLANIKEEQKKEDEKPTVEDFADDGVKRTGNNTGNNTGSNYLPGLVLKPEKVNQPLSSRLHLNTNSDSKLIISPIGMKGGRL